ncbi:MAG TPA: exodeoxyribonuclease VII small subunit [Deltaproteobacteria bacterium]|nr:exodeoxyribonuclease VII small subunit [Deltaproteobacteria bacterium]HQI80111.1 exodeoxyribonuclease VII small subunit [Deltaproteobacteria bacterium]
MKKAKGYSEVLQELEGLLDRMNRGEIPIDELEETVRSAAGKIRILKERLKATEAEITKVLREIEEETDSGGDDR